MLKIFAVAGLLVMAGFGFFYVEEVHPRLNPAQETVSVEVEVEVEAKKCETWHMPVSHGDQVILFPVEKCE